MGTPIASPSDCDGETPTHSMPSSLLALFIFLYGFLVTLHFALRGVATMLVVVCKSHSACGRRALRPR